MAFFFPTPLKDMPASIIRTSHLSTQTNFGLHWYPLLCLRKSPGEFDFHYNRDLHYSYNFQVKLRLNVVAKASDKLQSMLRKPLSVVYDTSSEIRSQFFGVSEAQNSTKRTIRVIVAPFEHIFSKLNSGIPVNFAVGFGMVVVFMVIAVKGYMSRQSGDDARGSVTDLMKRGQLRSDRRAISRPLNYDDPFNNPMVRMGKKNSTVKMCGKVFRLAPVSLTEEKALRHQSRRIRAYQWKRPTVFLKEGDPIPEGVDPETVRWIPANHPFATASNDIDEDFAQKNIYQKRGAPFRLRAEHEALQRKMMEATQNTSVQDDNGQAKST